LKFAIEASKDAKNIILHFLSKEPIFVSEYHKLTKEGIPIWFESHKGILSSDQGIRYLLTVLSVNRALTLKSEPKLDSITLKENIIDDISDDEIK